MPLRSRRHFLQTATASLAAAALLRPTRLLASPFGLPLGLQLYSVRDLLPKDYEGTLRQVAAAGYQEVEGAGGFAGHTAAEVKQATAAAGLRCVSCHYGIDPLTTGLDHVIDFHHELGAEYIICASPGYKTPQAPGSHTPRTIEDWRWNADQFNIIGKKVKAAGLRFGYHNHTPEFVRTDGIVPYDELLRLTDPALVTFEMDCGWVIVGGADPVHYLQASPARFSMFHVKDFKKGPPASAEHPPAPAELGQGRIDYRTIFAATSAKYVKHLFVELEGFDMPPFEALKIDADYVRNLPV